MAVSSRTISVKLSDADIKEAIALWLNSQPIFSDMTHWVPENVHISFIQGVSDSPDLRDNYPPAVVIEARQ